MANLNLMVGIPASGKSTFCKTMLSDGDVWISRDAIRYSLLGPHDKYFAKETLVKNTFVNQINEALKRGYNVYADATHVDHKSRKSLINRITSYYDEVNAYYFNTPLGLCMDRNANREGITRVPDDDMKRLYKRVEQPELWEGFDNIYIFTEEDYDDFEVISKEEE